MHHEQFSIKQSIRAYQKKLSYKSIIIYSPVNFFSNFVNKYPKMKIPNTEFTEPMQVPALFNLTLLLSQNADIAVRFSGFPQQYNYPEIIIPAENKEIKLFWGDYDSYIHNLIPPFAGAKISFRALREPVEAKKISWKEG